MGRDARYCVVVSKPATEIILVLFQFHHIPSRDASLWTTVTPLFFLKHRVQHQNTRIKENEAEEKKIEQVLLRGDLATFEALRNCETKQTKARLQMSPISKQ